VTHYNVRRAPATSAGACPAASSYGTPVQVTNTASTSETYQDTGAVAGSTYCYLVTAVGSGGQESQAVVAGPVTSPAAQ
jgi:hypothetical protein